MRVRHFHSTKPKEIWRWASDYLFNTPVKQDFVPLTAGPLGVGAKATLLPAVTVRLGVFISLQS